MSACLDERIQCALSSPLSTISKAIEWQSINEQIEKQSPNMLLQGEISDECRQWTSHVRSLLGEVLKKYESGLHDTFLLAPSEYGKSIQRPTILLALWICADWKILPPDWLHRPVCELTWSELIGEIALEREKKLFPEERERLAQFLTKTPKGGPHSNPLRLIEDIKVDIYSFYTKEAAALIQEMLCLKFREGDTLTNMTADFLHVTDKALEKRLCRAKNLFQQLLVIPEPKALLQDILIFRVKLDELREFLSGKACS